MYRYQEIVLKADLEKKKLENQKKEQEKNTKTVKVIEKPEDTAITVEDKNVKKGNMKFEENQFKELQPKKEPTQVRDTKNQLQSQIKQEIKKPEAPKNVPIYRWTSTRSKDTEVKTTTSKKTSDIDIWDWDYYKNTKNSNPQSTRDKHDAKQMGTSRTTTGGFDIKIYSTEMYTKNNPESSCKPLKKTAKSITTQTDDKSNLDEKTETTQENTIKTKKKSKRKVAQPVKPKVESNRFNILPLYTAEPVTFEEKVTTTSSSSTKPKQQTPKKPPKAIIIGLPEAKQSNLIEELSLLGYEGVSISKLKTKNLEYPPILAQLPIGSNITEFKKINRLSNCFVEIQIYTGVQCLSCKSFGHSSKKCKRPPRCEICGLEDFICECEMEKPPGYCVVT